MKHVFVWSLDDVITLAVLGALLAFVVVAWLVELGRWAWERVRAWWKGGRSC